MPYNNGQQPYGGQGQQSPINNEVQGHADPLSFLSKRKRNGNYDASRMKKFQAGPNQDGYYNDRRPQDDDELVDIGRRSALPTILCIIGVIAFTGIVIYLKSMLG